jgi:hypothetical protein
MASSEGHANENATPNQKTYENKSQANNLAGRNLVPYRDRCHPGG